MGAARATTGCRRSAPARYVPDDYLDDRLVLYDDLMGELGTLVALPGRRPRRRLVPSGPVTPVPVAAPTRRSLAVAEPSPGDADALVIDDGVGGRHLFVVDGSRLYQLVDELADEFSSGSNAGGPRSCSTGSD